MFDKSKRFCFCITRLSEIQHVQLRFRVFCLFISSTVFYCGQNFYNDDKNKKSSNKTYNNNIMFKEGNHYSP